MTQRIGAKVLVSVEKVAPADLKPGDRVVYAGEAFNVDGEVSVADSERDGKRRGLRLTNEVQGFPMLLPWTLRQWDEPWMDRIVADDKPTT